MQPADQGPSRYLRIEMEPCSERELPWWAKLLTKLLPGMPPEFEKHVRRAHVWWLEIDAAGVPQREIGFDSDGNPIVLGPFGQEYCGYLMDASDDWSDSEDDSAEAAQHFEQQWRVVYEQFRHLETGSAPFGAMAADRVRSVRDSRPD